MAREPRMTSPTLRVLKVLLSDVPGAHYGLEMAQEASLPTGTIYPILARLERAGWVTSEWEQLRSVDLTRGRHPRRYYRLSPKGAERAKTELERVQMELGSLRRPDVPEPGEAPT